MSAGEVACVFRPENLLFAHGASQVALWQRKTVRSAIAFPKTPTDGQRSVFHPGHKSARVTEKLARSLQKALHELVEIGDRTQFGCNVERLVEFVRLSPSCGVQLGVGNGYGGETGDDGQKRFLVGGERAFAARVHQDGAVPG